MINGAELVDAFVAALRDIPELVDEMDGNEERIFAYHDRYPKKASIDTARYQMLHPGIMVAYNGQVPGGLDMGPWKHELSLTLRAKEEPEEGTPDGYYRLLRLIVKGVPAGAQYAGQPMSNVTVHASCLPMDLPASRRQTDSAGVDYWEILVAFTEIGDD